MAKSGFLPIAEELSFLYDYERVRNMRRPRLVETFESLSDGMRMGIISKIFSTRSCRISSMNMYC
jgi:hypothetical protein